MSNELLIKELNDKYNDLIKTITILSKPDKGDSLVTSEQEFYDFDMICERIFGEKNCPTSADCLYVTENEITLIEFKSGFYDKMSKDNYEPELLRCRKFYEENYECIEYKKLLKKKYKKERKILKDSLKLKAIESYVTLEKKMLGLNNTDNNRNEIEIKYIVVIDGNSEDIIENILLDLTHINTKTKKSKNVNVFDSVRDSLKRYELKHDSLGNKYLYDDIKVYPQIEFLNLVNSGKFLK